MIYRPSKLDRRSEVPIGDLLTEVFPDCSFAKGYKDFRLRSAWKEAVDSLFPGAGERTVRIWLREEDGVLFVMMGSSVVATRLRMYVGTLTEKLNASLSEGLLSCKVNSVVIR